MEGKGNGIKTVVVNMVEVGKALGRPPSCELTSLLCGCVLFTLQSSYAPHSVATQFIINQCVISYSRLSACLMRVVLCLYFLLRRPLQILWL